MRGYLFIALALWLQVGQVPLQQTSPVDGQVTDSNTGQPVPNATLHLMPLRYVRPGSSSEPQATSQADGSFHFDSVAAGTYVITAERAGFVPNKLDSKSQMITVTAGQAINGIAISLMPEGTISGVIEEEDGTPLPGSRVEALARLTTYGHTSLKLYSNSNADAQGKFVLSKLPPNDYYVVAEPASVPEKKAGVSEKKPASEGELVRTFYPRSLDMDGGSAISLSAGQSVPDITVRVRRSITFHIRGKVADGATPAGVAAQLRVAVSPRGSVDSQSLSKKIPVKPDKTFDVGGLTSGAYTLRLTGERGNSGRSHALLARQDVEIGGANVDGIVLSVMPALAVAGEVRVDSSSNSSLPVMAITARPLEDMSHASQGFAKMASDGSFSFNNLDPGLYIFAAHLSTAGWYVKSMALNQQDVLNKQADLSEMSSARLEVVVSPGAGEVDATVQGGGSDSAQTDAGYTIVLVPETVGPDGSGVLFGFARSNVSFSFRNVRPGKYFGYAVQRGDPDLWQNSDFLKAVEGKGVSLQVAENSTQQLQLPVLPLEQVEQAASRVGLPF